MTKPKRIFIIGHSGASKWVLAEAVAKKLGWKYVNADFSLAPSIGRTSKKRNDGIDLLRGISIISVILLHCRIHIPFDYKIIPQWLYNIIFGSGYYGVIIFFVISGFLITSHCLERWGGLQHIHARAFYRMRFARIMPCLLVLLMILSALDLMHVNGFTIHNTTLPSALFAALTFHINYLEAKVIHGYIPGGWDVLWSLSVEEVFYFVFPIVCLLSRKPKYFIAIMILFIFISPFARTFSHPAMWQDYSYFSGMGDVAMGCLAALFSYHIKINKKLFCVFLVSGLVLFSLIFIFRYIAYVLGLTKMNINVTLLTTGTACLLIVMKEWYSNQNHRGAIWLKPIRFFGKNSYEIYLTHMFIILLAMHVVFHSTTAIFIEYAAILVLCAIVGQIVSHYFSEPMNKRIRATAFLRLS